MSVSEGGAGEETELVPLAYPYKCAFSCVYANSTQAPVPCSDTSGYCPIVEGMPEYLAFQTALSDFYNSSEVHTHPNLSPLNFRQTDPFELTADFNGAD